MTFVLILLAVVCLAYANGANDNFKGVATLFGSGTANYRGALQWATITTLLGSLTAVVLAQQLLKKFSGGSLVGEELAAQPDFVAAVGLGAGLTVLLATWIGMPISTTHGLIGALVGAGLSAGSAVDVGKLASGFFLPLLVSPVIAIVATTVCYLTLHQVRRALGITAQSCFCVGTEVIEVAPVLHSSAVVERIEKLTAQVGNAVTCRSRYQGKFFGWEIGPVFDQLHFLSAGAVSFARGLNDTPKIAALLLIVPAIGSFGSTALVGLAIAVGGLLSARRVAEMMSQKITPMNHGQGFTANLVTSLIVIGASSLGMPVSTTHVSCGALFGIGAVTQQARWGTIGMILVAWVTTLPVGVLLGAVCYRVLAAI
jgi:inorganic phosphate transporter, PiT family